MARHADGCSFTSGVHIYETNLQPHLCERGPRGLPLLLKFPIHKLAQQLALCVHMFVCVCVCVCVCVQLCMACVHVWGGVTGGSAENGKGRRATPVCECIMNQHDEGVVGVPCRRHMSGATHTN